MKLFIFVVAALAALQTISCNSYGEEAFAHYTVPALLAENKEGLEKTTEQICPGYGLRMDNVTDAVNTCLKDINLTNQTLCSAAKKALYECALPMTSLLDECLPKQSKKIPTIVVKMIGGGVEYLCNANGEHLVEYLNPCFRNVTPESETCLKKFSNKADEIYRTKEYPSAQVLCEVYESFRPCLKNHLDAACGHPITKDSFLDLYDQLLGVCKSEHLNEIDS